MDLDDGFDEELYIERCDAMNKLFPKLKFDANEEHLDILDDVLVKNKDAIVWYTHNTYYYSNYTKPPVELIYIKRDKFITYRDFYVEMQKKWENECGDHRFLELIHVYNETQIELFLGS
tara:strand:- start:2032 stop:2388 length:357 start_codon:yes stop_codon:yes gene_type:complete